MALDMQVTRYRRDSESSFTCLGNGALGGKALGLAQMQNILAVHFENCRFGPFQIDIPQMIVLRTGLFEAFLDQNNLHDCDWDALSDDEIALFFQRASLPATILGDLMNLMKTLHRPLAIRSSSMLEDAAEKPFAGVYATKMIPNQQVKTESRFHRLVEAIKFVYASLYFRQSRQYARAVGLGEDRMAVILQEVVGCRHADAWYPHISGVARSFNFYPTGNARPEEGVINLALGLGKTIVDGGRSWTYCPAYPKAPPPASDPGDLLKNTQTEFWAVNMGKTPVYDPIRETEHLALLPLEHAEADNVLRHLCSTYDGSSDRFYTGLFGNGPRLVDFAPMLKANMLPLNDMIRELIAVCEAEFDTKVEIEFAATVDENPRLGFLQVRPMTVSTEFVSADPAEFAGRIVLASGSVMGNGARDDLHDIVFVKPDVFDAAKTRDIALDLAAMNETLTNTPYLLIGFGRWGSSDPWLGIPVVWSQIAGAAVIVEATLPSMNPDLSQGSHFFHNISSQGIPYFAVKQGLDWDWLQSLPVVNESRWTCHVRTKSPFIVRADGRTGSGLVAHR
ncbi:MAG: PEP/pyruvate-binding domain-containing protein [Candidatus Cloacimonetes bacterium]|nr:PEP/pyruvate-binding domain-containing protein [Candidatus Cloacimonadota bacterium]